MDLAATKPPYRKLVSVRRVSRIKPLNSSQTHEVAMVDGWPVVVKKGQFAVNQQVLYFAIDCFLPFGDDRYESYCFSHFPVELHGEVGWAVQTVVFEGHISQGMVFAMNDAFPEIICLRDELEKEWRGNLAEMKLMSFDLKNYLGIRKWSTFYPRDGGVNLGRSPSFLPAIKSERVQNIPELWKTHGDTEFQITEILDGMPMIFYDVSYDDSEDQKDFQSQLPGVILDDEAENGVRHRLTYGVSNGSHDYKETEASISWKAVTQQGIIGELLAETAFNFGLAGVLCGRKISGNPLMIDGHRVYVYAVCDEKFKTWKTTDDHDDEWDDLLKSLERVPKFSTRVRLSAFAEDLDELMKKAQGASCVSYATRNKYPLLKRKGLAFRALDGSFSFKVIADDWLLDETEKLRQNKNAVRPGPNDCV